MIVKIGPACDFCQACKPHIGFQMMVNGGGLIPDESWPFVKPGVEDAMRVCKRKAITAQKVPQ